VQKINPMLWFDDKAEEAANFYVSLFGNSNVSTVTRYGEAGPGAPGSVMTVTFELAGQDFVALNAGPHFKFNPSISLYVACETAEEIDALWAKLSEGGSVLMELGKYPFSEKFGWCADRFGLTWQLNLASFPQKISPCLMYVQEQSGRAEEAMKFYTSLFKDSSIDRVERYAAGEPGVEGTVKHGVFSLEGQKFIAMDGGKDHAFTFNEAISLVVNCETQAEVDEFWEKLSEGGEKSQCGWVKDKFGLSWQITPTILARLYADNDPEKSKRVMQAMLQMTKLDIAALKRAYEGS